MLSIRKVYAKDIHAVRVLFIIILFWGSVSVLADNLVQYIHEKYKLPLWKIHIFIVILLLFIIILDPYTFERI
jgi:TRAP-type C4-dicarboxylate transport system permease small subunit